MSIIKKAIILRALKKKPNPKGELTKLVTQMDEYQASLVLSFVINLFGSELNPEGQACEVMGCTEEQNDLAA